jgi:hypothetical protein
MPINEESGSVINELAKIIREDGDKTRQLITELLGPADVEGFNVSFQRPTNQKAGRKDMPSNVKSLGTPGAVTMLDDQSSAMVLAPLDSAGAATALNPSQPVPGYTVTPGTAIALVSPNPDATGLTQAFSGVKGQAGVETITATYTNADGTVVTATGVVTTTIDPAELDVGGFNVSFTPPAASKVGGQTRRP